MSLASGDGPRSISQGTCRRTMNARVRTTTASSCQRDVVPGHAHDAEVVPFTRERPTQVEKPVRRAKHPAVHHRYHPEDRPQWTTTTILCSPFAPHVTTKTQEPVTKTSVTGT